MVRKKASIKDKVKFTRFGLEFVGEVFKVNDNSVIVKLNEADTEKLNLDTPYTVVSHKNYKLIN